MNRLLRIIVVTASFFGALRVTAADMKQGAMAAEITTAAAKVSAALAADDLAAAKTAAGQIAEHAAMAKNTAIADKAKALAKAGNIEDARKQLAGLMAAVEPIAKGQRDFVVMNCPMMGDWIQTKGDTKNPYYGKAMLSCGAPKQSK